MRTKNLSYPAVADRFIAGVEGYSHCPCGRNPRMYTDGKTIWSYGPHFPIARHEGVWHMPGGPVKIISRTSSSYSSTTNRQISLVHRKIVGSSKPECRVLEMRYDLSKTLTQGCELICENSFSKITKLMLGYSRCSREWSKRNKLYWVQCALHQKEAAEWILGKRTDLSQINMPEYQNFETPPWDLLMCLVDFISPHLNLNLNLSQSLPTLYRKVKKNCQQKVWANTGLSPKTACSKSADITPTSTTVPTVENGSPEDQPSTPKE